MTKNTTFYLFSVICVIIWGAYPAVLALVNFSDPFMGAFLSISFAAAGWTGILLFQKIDLRAIWPVFLANRRAHLIAGLFFALEVACFVPAVRMSPQTAAVLFEIWVIAFVVTHMWRSGKTQLSTKSWVFFFFGFCGASIAVIDLANLERVDLFLLDPMAVVLSVVAAISMGCKTEINAEVSKQYQGMPSLSASTVPHLISAFIAIPIWAILAATGSDASLPDASWIPGVISVGSVYLLGVPIFILAVRIRPNEAAMSIFYVIPLVALVILSLLGVSTLSAYFVLGASIIFISNVMLSQPLQYVSASGVTAVLTLIVTWLMISVDQGYLRFLMVAPTDGPGISGGEAFMVFYGLIFAYVLGDLLNDIKSLRSGLFRGFGRVQVLSTRSTIIPQAYANLWRQVSQPCVLKSPPSLSGRLRDCDVDQEIQEHLSDFAGQSLRSVATSTPYSIFRILSVGFLVLVFLAYCLSGSLLDRLVGLLLFALVSYFLFYSRAAYIRNVVVPMVFEDALTSFRPQRFAHKSRRRRENHQIGVALLTFALILGSALNMWVSWDRIVP